METVAGSLTRRETVVLAGSSLLALTSCTPRAAAVVAGSTPEELARQQKEKEDKARALEEEKNRFLQETFKQESEKRKALVDEERKSLKEHYEAMLKRYDEKNAALTMQLLNLAAKTSTTPEEKQAIQDAVKPPQIDEPPKETDTDDKSEEQRKMIQMVLQALLAIFFPELAAFGGFGGGEKSEGLSNEESKAFARHISTGEPMSKDLERKVRRNPMLNNIDGAVGQAREHIKTPPYVPSTSVGKPSPTPTPVPPPTGKEGVAPPVKQNNK